MAILRSRAALISTLALVALLLLLAWLPTTQWARQVAFTRLREALRQQDVSIDGGQLDYDLLGPSASLTNFTIRAAHAPGLAPIATVKSARIAIDWKTVSTLTFDVDSAMISGLQLHLVIGKDGRTNLPQPPPSTSKSSRWPIRRLVARDASLLVEDRQHDATLKLQPWTLTMAGRDLELLTSKPGELLYRGKRLTLDQVSLSATLESDALRIKSATLTSGPSRLDLSGNLEHFNTLDVRVKSKLDVASAARFLGRPERFGGQLTIEAAAAGKFDQLQLNGTLIGQQLAYEEFVNVGLNAKASYDGLAQRVQVARLQPLDQASIVTHRLMTIITGRQTRRFTWFAGKAHPFLSSKNSGHGPLRAGASACAQPVWLLCRGFARSQRARWRPQGLLKVGCRLWFPATSSTSRRVGVRRASPSMPVI